MQANIGIAMAASRADEQVLEIRDSQALAPTVGVDHDDMLAYATDHI